MHVTKNILAESGCIPGRDRWKVLSKSSNTFRTLVFLCRWHPVSTIHQSLNPGRIPLILGIWGGKGCGKSFNVELCCREMGVTPIVTSAGELEDSTAGRVHWYNTIQ